MNHVTGHLPTIVDIETIDHGTIIRIELFHTRIIRMELLQGPIGERIIPFLLQERFPKPRSPVLGSSFVTVNQDMRKGSTDIGM